MELIKAKRPAPNKMDFDACEGTRVESETRGGHVRKVSYPARRGTQAGKWASSGNRDEEMGAREYVATTVRVGSVP